MSVARNSRTLEVFDRVATSLHALARARRTEFDEDDLAVYVDMLADLDPALVDRACREVGRTPRAEYTPALPEVGELIRIAKRLEHEDQEAARRAKVLPAPDDADPRTWVFCSKCDDRGQRLFRCPGVGATDSGRDAHLPRQSCGRTFTHAAHGWADPCTCVEFNPVIARRREAAAGRRPSAA